MVPNSIDEVAGGYSPERQRATAISIGGVALFAGIPAAVPTGGPLLAAGGLGLVLDAQAALAIAAAGQPAAVPAARGRNIPNELRPNP